MAKFPKKPKKYGNRNKVWSKGHLLERFDVISLEGVSQDMRLQYGIVKYYEDITDPTIHVEILCNDTNGIMEKLPIRSGSSVNLKFKHESSKDPLEYDEKKEPLVVTNIMNHYADAKRETYILICETKQAVSNHTTRVWEKHTDLISTTVEKILKEKLEVDKERMYQIEPTKNKYKFCGNYRRPLKVVSDLCRKSIPTSADGTSTKKGTSGYFFFETQDGYNFLSIDTILESKPVAKYIMTPSKDASNPKNNFTIASEPVWSESHDLLKKLRAGSFKTANFYFNVNTRLPEFTEFDYTESVGKQMKKSNDEEVIPSPYGDVRSRIILGVIDQGAMEPTNDGKSKETPQDQAVFQAQSSARYSHLFSQTLQVTVPMNLTLRVGQMLELEFPEINTEESKGTRNPNSGNYMIVKLAHEFGNPQGDFTGLTLVRDTYKTK
tara:strand:- start:1969 stop:3279 length:1311 start_codon:yes stop_codon:yes gene_type:complete